MTHRTLPRPPIRPAPGAKRRGAREAAAPEAMPCGVAPRAIGLALLCASSAALRFALGD